MHLSKREEHIKINLEQLNNTGKEINRLENKLSQCRKEYESCLQDYKSQLEAFHMKLGKSLQRSRQYYERRNRANEVLWKMLLASDEYCYLNNIVNVYENMLNFPQFDSETSAIIEHKAQNASQRKTMVEQRHKSLISEYEQRNAELKLFSKQSGRSIKLSRPYFDLRARFLHELNNRRANFFRISEELDIKKIIYTQSLKRLEIISERIRKEQLSNTSSISKFEYDHRKVKRSRSYSLTKIPFTRRNSF
ncbi:hypothetical protein GJ496_007042 [Pomphorhynchus laevis]|nr:hypothetical protein GJ496_003645 [Pomphorhynchus laevis]KAI0984037.1 hypothetical protein GJ496_007042 [Pomphorhynchus laevis]